MNTFIWINHEIIIEGNRGSLLVRIPLEHVMVYVLFAHICGKRLLLLLLLFFSISRKANVLAVGDLILTIIWLEVVEHVLPELEVNIYWDFVRVT